MSDQVTNLTKEGMKMWGYTIIGMAQGVGMKHEDILPDGITDVKVTIAKGQERTVGVKNQTVVSSEAGMTQSISITLFSGQKKLSFSLNSLDRETIKKALEDNVVALSFVPEDEYAGLLPSDQLYKGEQENFDQIDNTEVTDEKIIRFAKELERGAETVDSYKNSRDIGVTAYSSESVTVATNGLERHRASTHYSAYATPIVEKPKEGSNDVERKVNYDYTSAIYFDDLENAFEIGRRAALDADAKLGAVTPKTAEMPIVLDPAAASAFFGKALSALNGAAVYRGTTFLKDKMGQQIFASNITITDDPTIKRSSRSMTTDPAGLEAKPLKFVENGILKLFNVNLEEGRKLGLEPIGREGGYTNVIVEGGTQTPEEIMADIEEGIYVLGFNGGTVNLNDGSHSRQAYGFMIENGQIMRDKPVSGFVVAGNLSDMMLEAIIANDTPQLPNRKTSSAAPTTRLNKMKIAGS